MSKKTKIYVALVLLMLLGGLTVAFKKNSYKAKPEVKVKTKTATRTILGYSKEMTVSCYTLVETPSDGKFANGDWAKPGNVVASNNLGFGTEVKIEGFDGKYVVKDRFQRGWQNADLDIYFGDSLEDYRNCKNWGKKDLEVLIYQDKDSTFTD